MSGLTVSVPVSFDTSTGRQADVNKLASHPVVETILPPIMKRIVTSTKLNTVSEAKMREVLNNIVCKKIHIKLPPPYAASNHPDAVLLYDALRSSCAHRGMNHSRELWRQFVSSNVMLFELLMKEIRSQRPPLVDAAAEPVQAPKRRRVGESAPSAAGTGTSAAAPTAVDPLPPSGLAGVDACGSELMVLGQADEDGFQPLKMGDLVLAFQQRPDFHTPPSSPKRVARVVVPTASDRLLRAHLQTRDSKPSLTDLFQAFDLEGSLVPESYAPQFDRNDLYITNAASARTMYDRAAAWSDGDSFLYHVLVTYTGPMDLSKQPFTCVYVTWCWEEEASTFLHRALTGEIRLNDDFTRLIDRAAKLHHGATLGTAHDVHIHRFFNLSILQTDVAPPANDGDLPGFLCDLASVYNEVRSDTRDATHIGLNQSPLLFARHRLIYESGSLQNYRLTWMLIASKKQVDAAVSLFETATLKAARTLVTLQHELYDRFKDTFPVVTSRVGQEIQVLAKLCLDMCANALQLHKEAQSALKSLQSIATEHNKHVQGAYAAARVEQYCNNIPIPRALTMLYNSVIEQSTVLHENERVDTMHAAIARIHRTMQSIWFMHVSSPAPDGHEKVLLLHALVILKLWVAQPVSDELRTAPLLHLTHLPEPPPGSIRMKVVQKAYRKACLAQHPDRNKHNEAEATTRTQQIGSARTLVVNHLVPSSSRSRSLRGRSDSGSSD